MTNRDQQTTANKAWEPPRGLALIDLPHRPKKPFGVQWRVDGKRKTKSFATAGDRLTFAKKLAGDVKELGTDAYRLNPDEARDWRAFRAQLGPDVSLDAVLTCWLRHGKARAKLTVEQAVAAFLTAKVAEGMTKGAQSHYRAVFKRLKALHGAKDVTEVKRDDINSWAADLDMEDWSRRTNLNRVRGLFRWLRVSRHIDEDPCDGIRPVKVVPKEAVLITPEQGTKLFADNSTPGVENHRELCGRLALEAFAGIRFESARSMVADDIKFDMRGILLTAGKIKTRKRKFIQNLTGNLWKWLEWSKPETWSMTPRQYMNAKCRAFIRAKVPHPRNCLRKCAATYHLAAFADAGRTAAMLCHTSLAKLINDYNGIASSDTGKLWFGILPPK